MQPVFPWRNLRRTYQRLYARWKGSNLRALCAKLVITSQWQCGAVLNKQVLFFFFQLTPHLSHDMAGEIGIRLGVDIWYRGYPSL